MWTLSGGILLIGGFHPAQAPSQLSTEKGESGNTSIHASVWFRWSPNSPEYMDLKLFCNVSLVYKQCWCSSWQIAEDENSSASPKAEEDSGILSSVEPDRLENPGKTFYEVGFCMNILMQAYVLSDLLCSWSSSLPHTWNVQLFMQTKPLLKLRSRQHLGMWSLAERASRPLKPLRAPSLCWGLTMRGATFANSVRKPSRRCVASRETANMFM